ncbi:MAG: UDP-N-acetylmuramate--L-alanine ligase [bacterium]
MFGKTEHIHFVGIGGIGMSGLAIVLHNLKFKVTGSDINRTDITRNLRKKDIKVFYNHEKSNITGADVVVYSTAIKKGNPEITEARRINIPIIHRGEMLAELTRMKIAVCVSGTHGKTTTTSIIGEILEKGGFMPTTVIGGIIKGKSQAKFGKGDYLVCEADESDKSFLRLYPSYAVISNIEAEHLDHYRDLDEIKENFIYFANHVPFWGCTFLGVDFPSSFEIRDNIYRRTITYGFNERAELRVTKITRSNKGCSFNVTYRDKSVGRFNINLLGNHNISNTLAAIGVGIELGVPKVKIKKALAEFRGVHRRIEFVGEVAGVKIFDDYGHHPTEIAVTLETIHTYFPKRRIISVFQPHRYTRTYHLFDDFALSFLNADIVIVSKIYGAHEIPIPGVSGKALAKRISKDQNNVHFIAEIDDILIFLKKVAQRDDIIVIQGAGSINHLAKRLLKELP